MDQTTEKESPLPERKDPNDEGKTLVSTNTESGNVNDKAECLNKDI